MQEKVAIFVDWDNLRYLLQKIKRKNSNNIDCFDFNNPSHLTVLFQSFLEKSESFYRIFFYTAQPLTDDEIEKQLKNRDQKRAFMQYKQNRQSSVYDIATEFLNKMIEEPYVALRCGMLKVRGIKNGRPEIVQKQVDMLMGLDISEVTFNKYAQKVLIFSKDTDMKPALKMARINGMEVIVANFDEENYLANEILTHCDIVRSRSLENINNQL